MRSREETIYIKITKGFYMGCGGYLITLQTNKQKTRVKVWRKKIARCISVDTEDYEVIAPYYMK